MKNKKLISAILFLILNLIALYPFSIVNAETSNSITINVNKDVTRADMFNYFAEYYEWQIPESYKYINVDFKDVTKWSKLESSLQKLIYLNLIENPKRNLEENSNISAWWFYRLSEKVLWIKVIDKETKKELLERNANSIDLLIVKKFIWNDSINIDLATSNSQVKQKQAILNDVYQTLTSSHYDKEEISKLDLLNSAIEWLTKWTDDKHTVYFPPINSQNFQDILSWEYEGIWSYVDMEKPGVLRINSPIPGSPSEKAWLKWWDIVTKVDWREVKEENSLNEVITWIKGPAWTEVVLTINRNWTTMDISVKREKIVITDIDAKELDVNTYYIQIKSFWEHVSSDFKKVIEPLSQKNNITKIIIDLRNNWGWYLTEVTEMLSYFVPKWENTAVVKYHTNNKEYVSKWYDYVDFNNYKIVILENSWTASASEILIWTLSDYFEDIEIIWEQSYWKWSVQVMKNYADWSLLKYTIAKWFTGWTETWIDWIGITPTYQLDFDYDKYKNYWIDNQLEKAKNIR